MKITEKVLIVLFLIGILFDPAAAPFGIVLEYACIACLPLFYISATYWLLAGNKEYKTGKKIGLLLLGILIGVGLIGVFLKLILDAESKMFLLVCFPVLLIAAYTYHVSSQEEDTINKSLFTRSTIWGGIFLLFLLMPMEYMIKWNYRDCPALAQACADEWNANSEQEQEAANKAIEVARSNCYGQTRRYIR